MTLWSDQESGQEIVLSGSENGRCCIQFHLEELAVTISSPCSSLISACLGARSHFASPEGSCEFIRHGDTVVLRVQQWRGPQATVELEQAKLEFALRSLSGEKGDIAKDVRLF